MPRSIKIGLTVISALVIIYLVIAWVKRIHFFSPEETAYRILFADVSGLKEGDPIQVRGYTAGRVTSILPGQDYVEVGISLDSKILIKEDAIAEIQLKELMGGKQIAMLPGSSNIPLPPFQPIIGNTAWDFSSSFSRFGKIAEKMPVAKFEESLAEIDTLFAWMNQALDHLEPETPGNILTRLDLVTHEMARVANMSRKIEWEEKIKDGEIQATHMYVKVDSLLSDVDLLVQKMNHFEIDSRLEKIDTLLIRMDTVIRTSAWALNRLEHSGTLANRLLTDENLSQQLDSVIYHLNKTLQQIHSRKVIVGLKRNRNKSD